MCKFVTTEEGIHSDSDEFNTSAVDKTSAGQGLRLNEFLGEELRKSKKH